MLNHPGRTSNTPSPLVFQPLAKLSKMFGKSFEAKPVHCELAKKWTATQLIGAGKMKVHPISVGSDVLQGAIEGLADMKEGTYGAEKLAYGVTETP